MPAVKRSPKGARNAAAQRAARQPAPPGGICAHGRRRRRARGRLAGRRGKARQQQRQHNRETQDREIQWAAGVGVNGVQLGVQRVAAVLSVKARGRQRQAVCLAGEIQAAGPAAGRRRGHRPVPTLAGDCGGFIGSGNVQVQPHVFLGSGVSPSASETRPSSCKL